MTADTVGGVWIHALELVRALQAHDVEVHLAVMGEAVTPDNEAAAAAAGVARLHQSSYKLEWMSEPWDDLERAGAWLLGLERETAPDVIHLNSYAHACLPFEGPVLVVGHSCVLSWWMAVKGGPAPPEWARYRSIVGRGLRAADAVVAPTQAMLKELQDIYGLDSGSVIANGRRPEGLDPLPEEPFVLAAGRLWDAAKNVEALLTASPRLAWPVRVAGPVDEPGREGPSPRPDDAGGSDGFGAELLGPLAPPALADLMRRAAIFTAPARYEPFGLAPLEAGLAGCALVLGDIPTLREVWGDAALFVDPDSAADLTQVLTRLIEDTASRHDMQHRARTRALAYGPGRMAHGYLGIYRALEARPHELQGNRS